MREDYIEVHVGGLVGRYYGGAYIDLRPRDTDPSVATYTVNVYDYAAGKPTIPFEVHAVREAVVAYIFAEPNEESAR